MVYRGGRVKAGGGRGGSFSRGGEAVNLGTAPHPWRALRVAPLSHQGERGRESDQSTMYRSRRGYLEKYHDSCLATWLRNAWRNWIRSPSPPTGTGPRASPG